MTHWKVEQKEMKQKIDELNAALEAKTQEADQARATIGFPPPVVEEAKSLAEIPPLFEEPNGETTDEEIAAMVSSAKEKLGAIGSGTKPWEKKSSATPWRQDVLKLTSTRPGFHQRWVRKDLVEDRMMRGYVVAEKKDYKTFESPLKMGTDVGTYVTRGDLVLMEVPLEIKQERDKRLAARTDQAQNDAKERVRAHAKQVMKDLGVDYNILIDENR